MTLMEVMNYKHGCANKNGCSRQDFCAAANAGGKQCGPCDKTAAGGLGACTVKEVDVDKETEIVNSMTKEELLDIAAEVMMDEYMFDE